MGCVSLFWGIVAVIVTLIGVIPFLGALNWLIIPFNAIGVLISVIVLAVAKNVGKGTSIAGLILCFLALLISVFRLIIGSGVV